MPFQPAIGPIVFRSSVTSDERIPTPEPCSAPEIVFPMARTLAPSYAVRPAPSVVVIVLSYKPSLCRISPVVFTSLVSMALHFVTIDELPITPDVRLRNMPYVF